MPFIKVHKGSSSNCKLFKAQVMALAKSGTVLNAYWNIRHAALERKLSQTKLCSCLVGAGGVNSVVNVYQHDEMSRT